MLSNQKKKASTKLLVGSNLVTKMFLIERQNKKSSQTLISSSFFFVVVEFRCGWYTLAEWSVVWRRLRGITHVRRLWTLYPVLNESLRYYRYYCGMRILRYTYRPGDGQDYYVDRISLFNSTKFNLLLSLFCSRNTNKQNEKKSENETVSTK